jgi:hypothetical protein
MTMTRNAKLASLAVSVIVVIAAVGYVSMTAVPSDWRTVNNAGVTPVWR